MGVGDPIGQVLDTELAEAGSLLEIEVSVGAGTILDPEDREHGVEENESELKAKDLEGSVLKNFGLITEYNI